MASDSKVLEDILSSLKSLQQENATLAATVDAISGKVNVLAGVKQAQDGVNGSKDSPALKPRPKVYTPASSTDNLGSAALSTPNGSQSISPPPPEGGRRGSITSKIILTSYPGQAGVDPCPMNWGAKDPAQRGPVVVSRNANTIRRRNGEQASMSTYCNGLLTHFISQHSVRMVVLTRYITLSLWQAKTSTSSISQTSQTQSPPPTSDHSQRGQTQRRLSPWTL